MIETKLVPILLQKTVSGEGVGPRLQDHHSHRVEHQLRDLRLPKVNPIHTRYWRRVDLGESRKGQDLTSQKRIEAVVDEVRRRNATP